MDAHPTPPPPAQRPPPHVWAGLVWRGFSQAAATLLSSYSSLVAATSQVQTTGPGAGFAGPAVYVHWHRHIPFLVPLHGSFRRWMMVASGSAIEPIARWCGLRGLHLARGASGQGGRGALERLQQALLAGESVTLAVDGPAGPAGVAKRGCVDLARAAHVPVIPVAYTASPAHHMRWRWDAGVVPLPWSRITVVMGEPVHMDAALPVEEDVARVQRALDGVLPG